MQAKRLIPSALFLFISWICLAQNLDDLPLFDVQDLQYKGAFRIPADEFGGSSMNYSEGPIAYNAVNHSLFVIGHSHQQAIAEFAIPEPVISDNLLDLNMAGEPLQAFVEVLNQTPDGNPQLLDRIGGMYHHVDETSQTLIVNAYEYYDAPADNTLTTLLLDDPNDLANSTLQGYYNFEGGAGHTSGWISKIPLEWQGAVGSAYITGQSSGIPIIARTSVGPSAFSFSMDQLLNTAGLIETQTLLDFSLTNGLNNDLFNESGTNDVWTHLSRVVFGFIVPGTHTYATFGYSGGHGSGVCYKCTQDNGNECGGYCTPDASDIYQYYWLWDMNDLMKVKSGQLESYDVLPYDYGEFSTPFENGYKQLGGGSYDVETGDLYLTVQRADDQQGQYSNPPVVLVYSTNLISAVDAYLEEEAISLYPNPTHDIIELRGTISNFTVQILDSTGGIFQTLSSATTSLNIDISTLPQGVYFLLVRNKSNAKIAIEKIIKQ